METNLKNLQVEVDLVQTQFASVNEQNSKLREGLEEATDQITLNDQSTNETLEALQVATEALKKSNGELQDEISRLGTQNQELKDQSRKACLIFFVSLSRTL